MVFSDETPVAMLKAGNGKTHRAYLWAYAPGAFEDMKAVVYDFVVPYMDVSRKASISGVKV